MSVHDYDDRMKSSRVIYNLFVPLRLVAMSRCRIPQLKVTYVEVLVLDNEPASYLFMFFKMGKMVLFINKMILLVC